MKYLRRQIPGEAQFVAVRILQMKVTLAPRRIARRKQRTKPCRQSGAIHDIDVGNMENDPPPPADGFVRFGNQVEAGLPHRECRECRIGAPGLQRKTERLVKMHGTRHIACRQRNGAHAFERGWRWRIIGSGLQWQTYGDYRMTQYHTIKKMRGFTIVQTMLVLMIVGIVGSLLINFIIDKRCEAEPARQICADRR